MRTYLQSTASYGDSSSSRLRTRIQSSKEWRKVCLLMGPTWPLFLKLNNRMPTTLLKGRHWFSRHYSQMKSNFQQCPSRLNVQLKIKMLCHQSSWWSSTVASAVSHANQYSALRQIQAQQLKNINSTGFCMQINQQLLQFIVLLYLHLVKYFALQKNQYSQVIATLLLQQELSYHQTHSRLSLNELCWLAIH